jgi:hypothetical protein
LEKEAPDALEMAEKENEERKTQKAAEQVMTSQNSKA